MIDFLTNRNLTIIAAAIIAFVSLFTIIQEGYFSAQALSLVVFLAVFAFSYLKEEYLYIILFGEIMVVNAASFESMLLIQEIIAVYFFLLYVTKKPLHILAFGASFLIAGYLFSHFSETMNTAAYISLCISSLLVLFALIQIRWRRIAGKIEVPYEG